MIILHSEKRKQKYLHFLKSGADVTLSFTRQEVFGNWILSLDKIRKRLMVSNVFNPLSLIFKIDLDKIRLISLKKVYRDIRKDQLVHSRIEDFLQSMHLKFEFIDGSNSYYIPVFEREVNELSELNSLERKAVNWQMLLSKLKLQ